VAEKELDGFELAADDRPVERRLPVGAVRGEIRALLEEEVDYAVAAVGAGVEEGIAPLVWLAVS